MELYLPDPRHSRAAHDTVLLDQPSERQLSNIIDELLDLKISTHRELIHTIRSFQQLFSLREAEELNHQQEEIQCNSPTAHSKIPSRKRFIERFSSIDTTGVRESLTPLRNIFSRIPQSTQPECPYGIECTFLDEEHRKNYSHSIVVPSALEVEQRSNREDCPDGDNCARMDGSHFVEYRHHSKQKYVNNNKSKERERKWCCSICTLHNDMNRKTCDACSTRRPKVTVLVDPINELRTAFKRGRANKTGEMGSDDEYDDEFLGIKDFFMFWKEKYDRIVQLCKEVRKRFVRLEVEGKVLEESQFNGPRLKEKKQSTKIKNRLSLLAANCMDEIENLEKKFNEKVHLKKTKEVKEEERTVSDFQKRVSKMQRYIHDHVLEETERIQARLQAEIDKMARPTPEVRKDREMRRQLVESLESQGERAVSLTLIHDIGKEMSDEMKLLAGEIDEVLRRRVERGELDPLASGRTEYFTVDIHLQAIIKLQRFLRRQRVYRKWWRLVEEYRASDEGKQMKHRNEVYREIVETEEAYYHNLQLVIRIFLDPLTLIAKNGAAPTTLGSQIISQNYWKISMKEVQEIFGNIAVLEKFHGILLNDLRQAYAQWPAQSFRLGKIFLDFVPYMKLYTAYVNNYSTSLATLARCRTDYRSTVPSFASKN